MIDYTLKELQHMNSSSVWNNRIILPLVAYDENTKFNLYATWQADLGGRYYVAVRSGREVNTDVRGRYNLM
tara:strand:- start:237 stop:449 length:213 start_codon:yes stop_codon:yes gene_type:complete